MIFMFWHTCNMEDCVLDLDYLSEYQTALCIHCFFISLSVFLHLAEAFI